MSEYEIRSFAAGDRDGFLSLYETVFGDDTSSAWFDWKYENNPYVDHVPIFLAERNDEIVGARSFLALELSFDGTHRLTLQPCDTMISREHRGRGLFFEMTKAAIQTYEDSAFELFFNFPSESTLSPNLALGWEEVGEKPTYYRIQNPRAMVEHRTGNPLLTAAGSLATPFVHAVYAGKRLVSSSGSSRAITEHTSIPVAELAELYDRNSFSGIHARRDETFYEWRFDNPDWDYVTYVAEEAGKPVAGAVVGRALHADASVTQLTDLVASTTDSANERIDALLTHILAEHDDADIVTAPPTVPQSVLTGHGFYSDEWFPLSKFMTPTTHVVYSLSGTWEINGLDVRNSENWNMSFVEEDTS